MPKSLAHLRHERSKKDFPELKLDDDEYVELVFGRAKSNLFFLWSVIGASTILARLIFFIVIVAQPSLSSLAQSFVFTSLALILVLALLASVLAYLIHRGNRLFITNKRFILSAIRFPWVRSEHSTELSDVRNVSFSEDTLILQLLHYGTLKLATAKNVYEFHDADLTSADLSAINNAISTATPPDDPTKNNFQPLKI